MPVFKSRRNRIDTMKKVMLIGSGFVGVSLMAQSILSSDIGLDIVVTEAPSKPVLKSKNYIASSMDDLLPKVYYDKKGKTID